MTDNELQNYTLVNDHNATTEPRGRTLYAVVGFVQRDLPSGYTSTRSLPTFYLDSTVQGIVSAAHAARIATEMLSDAAGPDARVTVAVSSETETAVHGAGEGWAVK